ncbi:MAG: hypothetical protein J1G02_03160 [Clostridiales bacterium]|nr:hypothetical protein [Clostridiales bacterium]
MTKIKKILSFVLITVFSVVAILVLCSCTPDEKEYHGNGVYATLYHNGRATVYAFDKSTDVGWYNGQTCIVPDTIYYSGNTYTVTTFGNIDHHLTALVVDGGHAGEIVIPETVTNIYWDGYLLSDTYDYLERITVASDNTFYRSVNGALYNKDGTELLLYPPAKRDTTFVVPGELVHISQKHYNYCNKYIQNIEVQEGNESFSVIDNVLYSADGKTLVYVPAGHGDSLALPDGVNFIGYCALRYANIVNLYIPQHIWRDEINDYQVIMRFYQDDYLDLSDYHPFRYVHNIYCYDGELPHFLERANLPYTQFHLGVSRDDFDKMISDAEQGDIFSL